jgi:hypothetical protein
MSKYENLSAEDLLDALDAVVWYNGIGEIVNAWGKLDPMEKSGFIMPEYHEHGFDEWTTNQLEVLWMIAVRLFGDYGTSPRSGWIEDIDGFRKFCHRITQTDREAGEL